MPEPLPKTSARKGNRHGDPSWSEVETDSPAPEATDRALGILARWLVRAVQGPASERTSAPAQNPHTRRLLPPHTREDRLD